MDLEADLEDLADPDHFFTGHDTGTPLCCAISCENLTAFRELLKRGADPHESVALAIGGICCDGWLPAVGPLLDAGVNADRALERAVRVNNVAAASICLQRGADPKSALEEQQRLTEEETSRWYHSSYEADGEDYEEDARRRNDMQYFLRSIGSGAPIHR
jgi:hypothetical protein